MVTAPDDRAETPEETSGAKASTAKPRPAPIKMSISEQATFLGLFCNKFAMRDGSMPAEVMTRLTQDDMRRFETIHQTMMIMEVHGADTLIRDKISRERRAALHKK